MNTGIREISKNESLESSAEVIRAAFRTVAEEFGLTKENCPTHPSFITTEKLVEARSKGLKFYGYFEGDSQAGFVAVEKGSPELFYMERLAVLPGCRHKGYGFKLVRHVLGYAGGSGGKKLSIGIIDEHTVLKNWYKQIGFRETGTKKFPHLPFTVCFMEIDLDSKQARGK
jgi:diamine N-acetyltransferase